MAVTVDSIRDEFTELKNTDEDLIRAKIGRAQRSVDPRVFGNKTDDAVSALAAHFIAVSPLGESAKLSTEGKSVYLDEFERIKRSVTLGPRAV